MEYTFTLYRPFIYLTCKIDNERELYIYDLFIMVPVMAGKTLEFNPIEEHPSTNIIRCKVVDGNSDVIHSKGTRFVRNHFPLEHSINSKSFNKDEFEVSIFIKMDDYIESKVTVHYEDADIIYHGNEIKDKTAFNCPYIYLAQPHDDLENLPRYFHPRMIIPLKGYRYIDYIEEADQLYISPGKNGICENLTLLCKDSDHTQAEIFFPLKINNKRYQDAGKIDGNFSAITLLFDTEEEVCDFIEKSGEEINYILANKEKDKPKDKTKSETKARSRSADTTPANGIFVHED